MCREVCVCVCACTLVCACTRAFEGQRSPSGVSRHCSPYILRQSLTELGAQVLSPKVAPVPTSSDRGYVMLGAGVWDQEDRASLRTTGNVSLIIHFRKGQKVNRDGQ